MGCTSSSPASPPTAHMTGLDLGSTSPVEAKSGLVDAAKVSDGKNVREILGAGADANLVGSGEKQGKWKKKRRRALNLKAVKRGTFAGT